MLQVAFVLMLLEPTLAFAYVDPGSGSIIVTSILGLIAAIGYTFRKYFYKLKRMVLGNKVKDDKEPEDWYFERAASKSGFILWPG